MGVRDKTTQNIEYANSLRLLYDFPELLLFGLPKVDETTPVMPDGNSDTVPPDSIPNSEVKRVSGDGSVGLPHARVAHRQAPI